MTTGKSKSHRPKRVVIREELVAITGDIILALVLNQLLYWTLRRADVREFWAEEQAYHPEVDVLPRYGWIYKSAEELIAELMVTFAPSTMRRYLRQLVELGYIKERHNPKYAWDRTLQYRVNIHVLQQALHKFGYTLDDFPMICQPSSKVENGSCETQDQSVEEAHMLTKITTYKGEGDGKNKHVSSKGAKRLADTESNEHSCSTDANSEAEVAQVLYQWQTIFGPFGDASIRARITRILRGWATVHGWAGVTDTLQYADERYANLMGNPNAVSLIRTLLDNARREGRPYGSDTSSYAQRQREAVQRTPASQTEQVHDATPSTNEQTSRRKRGPIPPSNDGCGQLDLSPIGRAPRYKSSIGLQTQEEAEV